MEKQRMAEISNCLDEMGETLDEVVSVAGSMMVAAESSGENKDIILGIRAVWKMLRLLRDTEFARLLQAVGEPPVTGDS